MCIIEKFERELRLLKRSERTIKVYSKSLRIFLKYFENEDIRYLSNDKIKDYIYLLHEILGYTSIIHSIFAIKFYYKNINQRQRNIYLPKPKKPKTIPIVLNHSEILKILDNISNFKHRCIIEVIYCHGLRRQELIDLKLQDIDSANMILIIKQSKGAKDRNIPLNIDCLNNLRKYYKIYKPQKYLFEGYGIDNKYSATSIKNILDNAVKKAGINKKVKIHTLRHSFATYLVLLNINLRKIQEWLGHASSKTTEIYTHILYEENPIKLVA